MRNYVASVAVDRSGEVAAVAAPRGGLAIVVDLASGRYLGRYEMENVFGVAPAPRNDGFMMTSGNGVLAKTMGKGADTRLERLPQALVAAWDNHIVAMG